MQFRVPGRKRLAIVELSEIQSEEKNLEIKRILNFET